MELTEALESLIAQEGVSLFGIADTAGFQLALPDWHPRRLVPMAKRALVFGRPFVGPKLVVDDKTNLSNESYWKANEAVLGEISRLRSRIMDLLDSFGFAACNFGGFGSDFGPAFSYRLAQYEAGLGVYGRFGVCINPAFGCYYTVGVLLTDAVIPVTDRTQLEGFQPCSRCSLCADACPPKAIDPSKEPEIGYDRDKCIRYIRALKKKHGIEAKACSRCFSVCPWGYDKVLGKGNDSAAQV